MNQRIRQLAEQCRFEIQGINCEVLGQGFDEERFAELIVRECAEVVYSRSGHATPQDLYEHFGVDV
jgi:hypothetical protein